MERAGLSGIADDGAYALRIVGDSMAPTYRDGSVIVVSPAATVRKDDRVLVKTNDGQTRCGNSSAAPQSDRAPSPHQSAEG